MIASKSFYDERWLGLLVGAGVALAYAVAAAMVNHVFIPQVPLYFDLREAVTGIIFTTLSGALLGYIVNRPFSSVTGVVLGAFSGTLLVFAVTFLRELEQSGTLSFGLLMVFYGLLPLTVMLIPFTGLLRWSAGVLRRSVEEADPRLKWRTIAILVVLGLLVGSAKLYSHEEKNALTAMHTYMRAAQGLAAGEIPGTLQPVLAVVQHADQHYALELTDEFERFPIPLDMEDPAIAARMEIVFVHFESGESVACLVRLRDAQPQLCIPGEGPARQ